MARCSHSTESVTKRYSLSNSSPEDRPKRNVLRPGVFRNTGRRKSPIPAGEKEGGELVQPRRAGKNAAQTAISDYMKTRKRRISASAKIVEVVDQEDQSPRKRARSLTVGNSN
ncbi:unnamed protein product [Bemisia tabaci]|uniref:Uncharacterized protein n=1 Tax=Bemisia tabaci TaxID=7038 RepID=A0A9P0ABX8_BEMTA|nr:unnamed protein product [Bemisia tabaci]